MLRKFYRLLEEAPDAPPAGAAPAPKTWRDELPDDIKADPSLSAILDVPSLAKSYVHAQKLVGADKVIVPTQHATEDDWQGVFRKLGNPEKLEDYKVERPKDAPFDDEFVGAFKAIAHKAGVLPKQAQNLVNWFNEASKAQSEKLASGYQAELVKGIDALKAEWGQAYSAKLSRANQVLFEAGGQELSELLKQTGLSAHPLMIKAFAKVGDMLKEDAIPADDAGGQLITPAQADSKISAIFGNPDHPYHKPYHAGHKSAVAEMEQLFAAKFPNTKTDPTEGKFPRMST